MEGSAPQAAFYYQNNIAALKILDCLLFESDIQFVHLENYSRCDHVDDVIIYFKSIVELYQLKWSQDEENSCTIFNPLTAQAEVKPILGNWHEDYFFSNDYASVPLLLTI